MCIRNLHIYVIKDNRIKSDNFSMNVSTQLITGENCSYIHENRLSYCGESNLDDCKNCKRQGCTVVECGREDIKNKKPFVFFLFHYLFRKVYINYVCLLIYPLNKN